MRKVEMTPEALNDLAILRSYLMMQFGEERSKEIVGAVLDAIDNLGMFPNLGVDILRRFGVVCDYRCISNHKNYVFYRVETDVIKVIRVLDERQDYMRILFGIQTTSHETEEYWNE